MTRLEKYKILNTITPYFNVTKFPYNLITDKKIIFTQKEIDLVYVNEDKFFVLESKHYKPKKGGLDKITVYFYNIMN